MSEPRRLLSDPDGATPFERDLLESWSAEQPSAAARTRALGIASVATLATAGVTAGAGAVAPKAAGVAGAALVKGLLIGVAVAAAVTAAVVARTDAPAATTPQATVAPAASAPPAPLPATPPPTSADEIRAISPADLKSAPALASASAAARPVAAAASTVAVTGGSLSAEIAALDGARKALEDGDFDHAIGLVNAYEARFPAGTFTEEAEVLRIEALVKRGDRARAASAGQRFLAAHPTSPHAARIRAILTPSTP